MTVMTLDEVSDLNTRMLAMWHAAEEDPDAQARVMDYMTDLGILTDAAMHARSQFVNVPQGLIDFTEGK